MTIGEYNEDTSGDLGVVQIGTTAVTGLNFSLLRQHEACTYTTLYVNGVATDVRALYLLEGETSSIAAGAILKPRKDLGHNFFSGVDLATGTGEIVLSSKQV